ncbi:Bug family tripartite tricarboxylate transporter substrate binding protein [Agrococcus jejuensis]|uniref:Putative tricarboxylic transport membrane protein n=1 Tax=Agrococcus jejuensis TaxID=399736 RepID=A0A1G8BEY2_9MICO|nr:tripartite tricarboxylate transporter substrate-binding protein [Agrococcus jejuensis]SDH31777.1 putative tricarboxylic transport membrane protein [Agrococcus jejuensis]
MTNDAHPLRLRRTLLIGAAGLTAFALAACSSGGTGGGDADAAPGEISTLGVIAPADPGGGWDQTARAVSAALTGDDLVGSAPVTNIGGAGGTVGLASLATETEYTTVMVTGSVMVGAVETNASQNRIEDMTPIARLTEEPLVIVVPADSEFESVQDVVDAIVEDGPQVTVTGGSAGGIDHILAGQLLIEGGVDPADVPTSLNYIANSGGGEALTMLLGGTAMVGISGVGEFAPSVESGDLRALAVSSAEPSILLPDAPTLQDEGIDLAITNWRGLIAPGGISAEEQQALVDLITEMHDAGSWAESVDTNGWTDAFITGDEFSTFLDEDITLTQETLRTIGLTS